MGPPGRTATPASTVGVWRRRVGWLAAGVVVLVFVVGAGFSTWLQVASGQARLEDLPKVLGFAGFAVVGAVLVARRPEHPIGWLLATIGVLVGVVTPAETWAGHQVRATGAPGPVGMAGLWANAWSWYVVLVLGFTVLPLVFPDGRLPSRRWRPLAWASGAAIVAFVLIGGSSEQLHGQTSDYVVDNPIGIAGATPVEQHPLAAVLFALLLTGMLAGLAAIVVRFRRSHGTERQQVKWLLAALAVFAAATMLESVPVIGEVGFALALCGVPAAIGTAVLRHGLYDIDRILSRTASWTIVTAVLIGVYVAVAVVPAALFDLQSDVPVAVATLAAVAAFGPVRRRVQGAVDRRFNRRRHDAMQIVDAFGSQLGERSDLARVTSGLRAVLADTVQPSHVSVWLPDQPAGHRVVVGRRLPPSA